MRQASWGELFAPRYQPSGAAPEVPSEPRGWRRLFWWEDLLTFGLLGIILLAVIASIDRANWVDTMPSLYPVAYFGLFMGAALARLRWREGFIHLLALPFGAAASLGQIMSILPGDTPVARYDALHDRMAEWFHIAVYGGISNDDLPFIVLVVPLVWLTCYLSSWAIFRWQNAWLALIPAGATLLVNISFLPGDFSLAFVVFLLGATLLVTRLHLLERAKAWRAGNTPYPALLSLSVFHATFWLGLALLGLAWLMPQAGQTSALASVWNRVASPVNDRAVEWSRLFVSVNNKKSFQVHDFGDFLPFLGHIELPDRPVADVTTTLPLDQAGYLRAQVYDIYTAQGWDSSNRQSFELGAAEVTEVDQELLDRLSVLVTVIAQGDTGRQILTVGQPLHVNRQVEAQWTNVRSQIAGLVSPSAIEEGAEYQSTGSVSTATEAELRAAGTNYPPEIRSSFLRLPGGLPSRVGALATQWSPGRDNPYDQAVAIESYLRANYPYELNIRRTPPGRDTVDYFLFDLKRGYFDYHASAMVVLLRSLGVPSRLAVGYVIDPSARVPGTQRYRITEANAFAWPEVYFPGYGWVEFNPTPNHPTISRASGEDPTATGDEGTGAPDLGIGGVNPGDAAPGTGDTGPGGAQATQSSRSFGWLIIAIASALALAFVSGAAGARYAWVRGLSGLDAPSRLWGQTMRLASWARAGPGHDQTPREFARALRARVPGTNGAELLAESYVRHRYGREAITSGERARLEQAWRGVRGSLLRRLLHLS